MTLDLTRSLFGDYRPDPGVFDEMVNVDGSRREHWIHAAEVLDGLGFDELHGRKLIVDQMLDDEGVGYRMVDREVAARWPLDPLPALVPSAEWSLIEEAVIQRAVVLDLVQRDLYGPRDLLKRGLIPPEVVFGHAGFLRACDGITSPIDQQLLTYAADIVRGAGGDMCVLADRAQAPSGSGYALANRRMMSRVFPSLYRDSQVHRVAPYFRSLRALLERVADTTAVDDPRIVVLSPGSQAETSFEHSYLGSYLGFPVVEGGDLTMRDGRVHLRALGRLDPVDVILRRVDAEWCDPLEMRSDSQLGVVGLVEACRRGTVAVVNPLGSGVLENPGLYPFLPALADQLIGQDLLLPSVATWWCGEDAARSHVLANMADLVMKPISGRVGVSSLFGSELSNQERSDLRARIESEPLAWVAQERLDVATAPSLTDTAVEARPTTLRVFAVARNESYTVMAGGLTRVAPDRSSLRISNQSGATSKDTWVLASEPEALSEFWLRSGPPIAAELASLSPRAAENLFWLGRYAERTEAAARLLRAVIDRREGSGAEGAECVRVLLRAITITTGTDPGFVGAGGDERVDNPDDELRSLTCDPLRPGSLAYAVRRLLHAAETVRDQLSQDTWSVVGSLEAELGALRTAAPGRPAIVSERLGRILQDLLALHGLAADSMVRDSGWFFLDAGRRIERATQLASLLRATTTVQRDTATDSLLYESVLIASESIITYRRRYRSRAQLETLLDLLVADPGNPRSLRHQIDRLVTDIESLPGGNVPGRPTTEERLVLELSTRLRVVDTSTIAAADDAGERGDLDEFLGDVRTALAQVSEAIEGRSFAPLPLQRQLSNSVQEPA